MFNRINENREYQGKGYGKEIMSFINETFLNNYIRLDTVKFLDKNILFYTKQGYEIVDETVINGKSNSWLVVCMERLI